MTTKLPEGAGITRRRFILSATCLSGLALAGCTFKLPGSEKAGRRVRLKPAEDFPPNMPSVAWTLQVNEPTATLSLNTAKIAIGELNDIKYVANGEWASRAPDMVMELLVESFQKSNRILKVGDRRARLRPDFVLETRLSDFGIKKTGDDAGTVRVSMNLSLIKRPRRDALATASFSSTTELESLTLDNIVAGFNESLGDVMEQVVEWTLITGAAA